MQNPFRYFNSSPEVIRLAVMMYVRYPLSLRQVEDLLFERGIDICHETVRYWWSRFGPMFAAAIRKRRLHHRSFSQWRWHLDEVFVRINGETHYLWRAVDHEGEVLEVLATKRRDRRAALKFLKRTMKRYGRPRSIVTDRLRSYRSAMKVIGKVAKERPVYIAGSVSNYGLMIGCEPGWSDLQYFKGRSETSEAQARSNLREQAELLVEAGVDFLLAEATGSTTQRKWVIEACVATGLPVWMGFKCRQDDGDTTVKVGYCSDEPLAAAFDEVTALGGSLVTLFHSPFAATNAALPLVKDRWHGPIGIYPEAERRDYVTPTRDPNVPTTLSPEEFVQNAQRWVEQGVQVVGGCCGIEIDYIRPLREALPSRVPNAR